MVDDDIMEIDVAMGGTTPRGGDTVPSGADGPEAAPTGAEPPPAGTQAAPGGAENPENELGDIGLEAREEAQGFMILDYNFKALLGSHLDEVEANLLEGLE